MLPMFFFISAFVGYKTPEKLSDGKPLWHMIKNKIMTLLVPTALLYSFYQLATGSSPMMFFTNGFYGYWFAMTLFELYVVYYIVAYLLRRHSRIFDVLAVCAILFSGFVGIYLGSLDNASFRVGTVLGLPAFFGYLPIFLCGIMIKKYESTLLRFITHDVVFASSVVLYALVFLLNVMVVTKEFHLIGYYLLSSFVLKYLGVVMVFNIFYRSADFFNANGWLSRVMQFLGKRSLDLYLLHYFLIADFKGVETGYGLFSDIMIYFVLACILTVLTVALSGCLRKSPLLAKYLLGVTTR